MGRSSEYFASMGMWNHGSDSWRFRIPGAIQTVTIGEVDESVPTLKILNETRVFLS